MQLITDWYRPVARPVTMNPSIHRLQHRLEVLDDNTREALLDDILRLAVDPVLPPVSLATAGWQLSPIHPHRFSSCYAIQFSALAYSLSFRSRACALPLLAVCVCVWRRRRW